MNVYIVTPGLHDAWVEKVFSTLDRAQKWIDENPDSAWEWEVDIWVVDKEEDDD